MNLSFIISLLPLVLADASPPLAQFQPHAGTMIPASRLSNSSNAVAHCNPTSRGLCYPGSCILHLLQIWNLLNWEKAQEFREGVRPQIYHNDPKSKQSFAFVSRDGRCVSVVCFLNGSHGSKSVGMRTLPYSNVRPMADLATLEDASVGLYHFRSLI